MGPVPKILVKLDYGICAQIIDHAKLWARSPKLFLTLEYCVFAQNYWSRQIMGSLSQIIDNAKLWDIWPKLSHHISGPLHKIINDAKLWDVPQIIAPTRLCSLYSKFFITPDYCHFAQNYWSRQIISPLSKIIDHIRLLALCHKLWITSDYGHLPKNRN